MALWSLFLAAIGTLPLENFVGHSHWDYIVWIPSTDLLRSRRFWFDVVANVGVFMPFGYLLARSFPRTSLPKVLGTAALLGGLFSLGIEFYQVYCHNRHPSPMDLASNLLGSVAGAVLASAWGATNRTASPGLATPTPPDRSPAP